MRVRVRSLGGPRARARHRGVRRARKRAASVRFSEAGKAVGGPFSADPAALSRGGRTGTRRVRREDP